MKLFPSKRLNIELNDDYSILKGNLKNNTDYSSSLTSNYTNKAFRGQVNDAGFKLISSEIGRGAICVLLGKFDGQIGEVEIRIHNAFKVMFSILMLLPVIGVMASFLMIELRESFEIGEFLNMIFKLIIVPIILIRLLFIELSFRFVSKKGIEKLTNILSIKRIEKI